jgi:hypothetical protein
MRIAKVLPLVSMLFLPIGVSILSARGLPRCSASAPCFAIANRAGSAGLAVNGLNVAGVYLNGRLLAKGLAADYHVETIPNDKIMVIVHLPANTTPNFEIFQVITK